MARALAGLQNEERGAAKSLEERAAKSFYGSTCGN